MKRNFLTVRIVHSPREQCYTVEFKRPWVFRWAKDRVIGYADSPQMSPWGTKDNQAEAYAKAIKRAEALLAKTIVWQQANWDWQ